MNSHPEFCTLVNKLERLKNAQIIKTVLDQLGLKTLNPLEERISHDPSGEFTLNIRKCSLNDFHSISTKVLLNDLQEVLSYIFKKNINTVQSINSHLNLIISDNSAYVMSQIGNDKITIVNTSLSFSGAVKEDLIFLNNFYHYLFNYDKFFNNGVRRNGKSTTDIYLEMINLELSESHVKQINFDYKDELERFLNITHRYDKSIFHNLSGEFKFERTSDCQLMAIHKGDYNHNKSLKLIKKIYDYGVMYKVWEPFYFPDLVVQKEPISYKGNKKFKW